MLILGSNSPRRKEILEFFSIPFTQVSSGFDEDAIPFSQNPEHFAQEIARSKAHSLRSQFPEHILLTADTIVTLDGKYFGKPKNTQEAIEMLSFLSGKKHFVYTALCILHKNKEFLKVEKSAIELHHLSQNQIVNYIQTIPSFDKAGGYAIQKCGSLIVKRIEGCYYNVMGLPIQTLHQLLLQVGIDLWHYIKAV